jgi:hypothetical protein
MFGSLALKFKIPLAKILCYFWKEVNWIHLSGYNVGTRRRRSCCEVFPSVRFPLSFPSFIHALVPSLLLMGCQFTGGISHFNVSNINVLMFIMKEQ